MSDGLRKFSFGRRKASKDFPRLKAPCLRNQLYRSCIGRPNHTLSHFPLSLSLSLSLFVRYPSRPRNERPQACLFRRAVFELAAYSCGRGSDMNAETPPFCAREVGPSKSAEAREGGAGRVKGEVVFVTLGARLPHRIIPFEKRDAARLGYRTEIQRTKGSHPFSTLGDYFPKILAL